MTSAWPSAADTCGEDPAAVGVELGEHVVEQEERRDPGAVGDRLGLGEQQGEQSEPLFALGAEAAQIAVTGHEHDVVEMRSQ